ncbi:vitellogenin-like [Palaemon carinicauda]|uniref:vitellogenin-like n=1 Tax=Palaemon carinicauda TaxID=392227 RepID=UPI0035B61828
MRPEAPDCVLHHKGPMVKKNLLLDYEPPKKDASLMPHLDKTLKEICEKTKMRIEEDSAFLMAKALHFLRRIPGTSIEAIWRKITDGEICPDYQRLESLFLDAIAFVHEPSAVGIIVKQLLSGRATGGRAALYTAALHLTPRPDIYAIEALKPLFETSTTLSLAKLAAASMVHSYCKHNPYCREEAPVRQLAETLAAQVQQYCVASGDEESRQKALVCLKALGNMGVMSPENSMSVIKCIKTDAVQNDIRVAAAQSFRNSECHQQVTKELAAVATNQVTDTEVCIASYLAAVRCAEREDLDEIISKIVQEENTQVRSFILSHLLNLQESSDPYKERLRYLLSNFVLPVNFTTDFRKYSKNYHMSYFNQLLGLGAGYESNIIFSPGSYLPRSVDMNLTTVLGKIPINLGEFGVRFEGFEPIIKQLLRPKGYFWKTSFRKLLTNFINVLENKDAESFSEGVGHRREMRSIDISTVSDFLKKIYGKGKGKGQNAGAYVRYNGQEMVYGSWAGNLEDTDVKHLFDSFVNFFIESLGQLSKANVNTARTAQMKMDYSLASIQGIPLKLELEGTALFGFKLNNQQSSESEESAATLHLLPSLSLQIGGFVGFDSHLTRNGVKMENLVSSDSGLTIGINAKNRKELQLDINLPETMKILSLRSDIHLVRVIAGHEENQIVPDPVRDIRIKKSSCFSGMQSITGLHLCYDFDVPNIFRSTCLPLGRPLTFVLYAKKADVSMRGFSLKTSVHHGTGTKVLKVEVDTPGSSTPRKLAGTIMYERTPENLLVSASVESPNTSGNVKANLRHQDQYKAIEVVGNWNSNGMQSLASLRIDMESRWDPSDKQIDLKIYAGSSHTFSPDLMIMEIIFKEESNGEQKSLDFTAKTMGSLRRFLTLSAEAGVDLKYNRELKVLIPQKLRKLAMEGKIGSITLLATIQEESDSKYTSLLKISQMETELIGINARHDVIHSEGCELEIKTSAEGRIKDASYKGALILASRSLKKGFMLLIVRKTDNLNIVDIDIMHVNRPEISNTKFLVNIPEYMKMIKFESKLVKQEGDRYMLETAFIYGQETLLHIVGPVTMVFSVHSFSKLQADLKITTLASSQLTVSSALELSSKKTTFKVMTKHQEEILFSYNWVIQVDTSRQYNIKMDMIIPLVVNTEVEVMINAVSFHINMDTLVLPKQSPSRRIKALADLNLPNMEMRTNVAWDADRDPSKKLAADLKVTQSHVDSDRLALSGNLIYKSKNYRLFLEASGINMSPWKRNVRCQITTPTGETFKIDMNLAIRRGESFMEFQGQISCKDFGNRHHQFSEKLHLEGFHSQAGLKVLSQSRYESPGHHVTMLDMETKYNNIASQRLFAFQAKISSPSLHLPLEIELKLDNTEGNYKTFLIAHSETPLRILDYEVAVRIHR